MKNVKCQDKEYVNTFLIFHDGLSAWWGKEAQQYLTHKGFGRRQLCSYDPTNVGTRYQGKVAGDSPELCSGLDRNGFALNRQRESTILSLKWPIHPDCQEAFNILLAGGHQVIAVEPNDDNIIVHEHVDDEISSDSDEDWLLKPVSWPYTH